MPADCGQVLGYGFLWTMVAVGVMTTIVFAVNLSLMVMEWVDARH